MANGRLWVKAGANGPVILPAPIQGVGVVGAAPMEVDDTRFIRRRVAVGDLVLVPEVLVQTAAAVQTAARPSKEKE